MALNPYELHKRLINHYVLNKKGATSAFIRDSSRDKRDIDIIRENHKFVWDESDVPLSWEERLAKKYYDKLYKEYCICELSRYKENKFAMRWQTEPEMVTGKGQFICGAKGCMSHDKLKTWEVNFAYVEHGFKKNELVKLRLCPECSVKLNYRHKKREVKKKPKRLKNKLQHIIQGEINKPENSETKDLISEGNPTEKEEEGSNIWSNPVEMDTELSREDEFEQYLEQLLL